MAQVKRLTYTVAVFVLAFMTTTAQNRCTTGDIRLVNGVHGNLDGRLEVCLNGVWGTVCVEEWDENDARVVCRQLGVAEEELDDIVSGVFYGEDLSTNQPFHFEGVSCNGDEGRLLECPNILNHDCDPTQEVGIMCQRANDCTDGEVRLVGGARPTEGRVEYCVGGQWGTVCSSKYSRFKWETTDVEVVCRQIGHFTLDPQVLEQVPMVESERTPILLNSLQCTGSESQLGDCQHADIVQGCIHIDDQGANCTRQVECRNNEVRLVGGETDSEGIVEFCQSGYWGQVCNDGWDEQDARVVCRQLGYDVEDGMVRTSLNFGLGRNFRRVWLDKVECFGNEMTISQCRHNLTQADQCGRPNAGLVCPSSRIRGGTSSSSGSVHNGMPSSLLLITVTLVFVACIQCTQA